jgi:hypothetical protein
MRWKVYAVRQTKSTSFGEGLDVGVSISSEVGGESGGALLAMVIHGLKSYSNLYSDLTPLTDCNMSWAM